MLINSVDESSSGEPSVSWDDRSNIRILWDPEIRHRAAVHNMKFISKFIQFIIWHLILIYFCGISCGGYKAQYRMMT
jgi:hypothetical protein